MSASAELAERVLQMLARGDPIVERDGGGESSQLAPVWHAGLSVLK